MAKRMKPYVIGIIGGSGTGKSHLARYMTQHLNGVFLEGDTIGHQVLKTEEVKKALIDSFGQRVVTKDQVDRRYLGSIVFNDKEALLRLNQIVHPQMKALIGEEIRTTNLDWVILEAAVMIEAGFHEFVDLMIHVKASDTVRLQRLTEKRQIDRDRAQSMIASGRSDYEDYSQMMVDTTFDMALLQKELDRFMNGLMEANDERHG